MITRSSIAFEDFLGSSIAPQVMPPCQTPKMAVQGYVAVYVDINDVLYCLMLSVDVRRVSKKFLKGYLIAVYWFVQSLIAYKGVKGVLRPCVVYQMLYIGKAPRGKFSHNWQFWDIKIPKPPNLSSLKIIGFLHFLKFLGPLGKDYNLHSLIITLYLSKGTQMCL